MWKRSVESASGAKPWKGKILYTGSLEKGKDTSLFEFTDTGVRVYLRELGRVAIVGDHIFARKQGMVSVYDEHMNLMRGPEEPFPGAFYPV